MARKSAKKKNLEKPIFKTVRKSWAINPKTRVKQSSKRYKRSAQKHKARRDNDAG